MARNPSIYTGLQQSAATRRNRALRAARRHRALLRRGFDVTRARSYLQWDLRVEGAFLMSDASVVPFAREMARVAFKIAVDNARYWHRDWKQWAARNREWRQEMAGIDKQYPTGL